MNMHKQWFKLRATEIIFGFFISAAVAAAATTSKPTTPAKRPNWNGVWVVADDFMDKQDAHSLLPILPRASTVAARREVAPPPPKFKGKYAEQAKFFAEANAKGLPTPEENNCLPQGLARFWSGPYAFEIIQTPAQINFFQEWNEQTHRVYLDGRKHPEDPDPTYIGHSVGHWEGTTLFIDAMGFTGAAYLERQVHNSDAMHITEKIRQVAADVIEITQIIDDNEALQTPYTRIVRLRRKPNMEVVEYVCAQNNRDKP